MNREKIMTVKQEISGIQRIRRTQAFHRTRGTRCRWGILLLTLLFCFLPAAAGQPRFGAITARATVEDIIDRYSVTFCSFETRADGHIYGVWETAGAGTTFGLSLYYFTDEDCTVQKTLMDWTQVSGREYDFTKQILATGSYIYYFRVRPSSGGTANGETSEDFYVTPDILQTARKSYLLPSVGEDGIINTYPINIKESGEPGQMLTAEFKGNSSAGLESISYSVPAENWKVGEAVEVTLCLKAKKGKYFTDATAFTCKNATVVSHTGDASIQTVVLRYVPKFKLEAPAGVYISSSYILSWNKSDHAARYNIQFFYNDTKEASEFSRGSSMDISRYMEAKEAAETLYVRVFALADHGETDVYLSSSCTELEIIDENMFEGTFYPNQPGEAYRNGWDSSGWKKLSGKWFYFTDGVAKGPGWWQDTDGSWYYFDKHRIMMTGKITADGKEYMLNDGSVEGLPFGAWVEHSENVSGQ